MTNYIPDIPLEELVRIKKDIEGTKLKNGRSTSDTEFSWLYRLSQPLEILERIATSPESSALQIIAEGTCKEAKTLLYRIVCMLSKMMK